MNTLGKISLLVSIFSLLVTLGLQKVVNGWMPILGVGFGFALFFFIFALATNWRWLVDIFRSDFLSWFGKSTGWVLLLGVFVISTNAIVAKQNWYFDLTQEKLNSLQPLTKALLAGVNEPILIVYFHVDNHLVGGFEAQVREEIAKYQKVQSGLTFESYSIFERPDLAAEFRVGDEQSALYLKYKGRIQRIVSLDELEITNALLKVTREEKKIYFLTSGGARTPLEDNTFGLSVIKEQLERLHYQVEVIDSLTQSPQDAAAVLWIGPKSDVDSKELESIEKYVTGGGSFLLALDPGEMPVPGDLLNRFGFQYSNKFIFDQNPPAGQSPLLAMVHPGRNVHEVVRNMEEGDYPFFFISSPLEILPVEGEVHTQPLLEFMPNSIVRDGLSEDSAVASEKSKVAAGLSEGRLSDHLFRFVLIGDSDFMTNQFSQQPATFDFIMGLVTFLAKDEDLLKMRPPIPTGSPLLLTQSQLNVYVIFFILPFIALFFVLAAFFKLRRYF